MYKYIKGSSSSDVIETLLELGYSEKNYKGEMAKYYHDSRGSKFTVFINPDDGDCYIVENAAFSEINPDLMPIDTPEKAIRLDELASTSILKIEETNEQYIDRMRW